jgi:hypothetical protein
MAQYHGPIELQYASAADTITGSTKHSYPVQVWNFVLAMRHDSLVLPAVFTKEMKQSFALLQGCCWFISYPGLHMHQFPSRLAFPGRQPSMVGACVGAAVGSFVGDRVVGFEVG